MSPQRQMLAKYWIILHREARPFRTAMVIRGAVFYKTNDQHTMIGLVRHTTHHEVIGPGVADCALENVRVTIAEAYETAGRSH